MRAIRKEIRRLKKERDKFKGEAKLAKAELAKQGNQAIARIQNKVDVVFLVLCLFLSARIGFRAIARVLAVLGPYLGLLKTPCPQTVSNYVSRLSIAKMQTFVQSIGNAAGGAMETVWLIDISIGLGSGKILSVLALNLRHHLQNVVCTGIGGCSVCRHRCCGILEWRNDCRIFMRSVCQSGIFSRCLPQRWRHRS